MVVGDRVGWKKFVKTIMKQNCLKSERLNRKKMKKCLPLCVSWALNAADFGFLLRVKFLNGGGLIP